MSSQSAVIQLLDQPSHDAVVAESKYTPTVIYVSNSSLPLCRDFTPKYEALATKHTSQGVKFCQLEFTNKTSCMFKFAPNQLPVTVLVCETVWCKTIMGANINELEAGITQLLDEAKKGAAKRTDSPMQPL